MPNLFIVDLLGTDVSEEEKAILQHPNVGGLLLFTRNFETPDQLSALIRKVRIFRPDIFIAVDHEGGIVQRFQRHGFRALPAARVYGDVYELNPETGIQLAQLYGEIMAKDLLAIGIDLSIAPVLDVHGVSDVIAKLDRAFHQDPEVIVQLASAFIEGMNKAGMPAVGKHFPGHGSILADSHRAMPVSDLSEAQLRNVDLKPFIELIERDKLSAVMPAHVTYKAIDAEHPAGFSKIWLQDILRSELQFAGLILSDCLGMKGADIGNLQARARQALQAGCDMLIVCNQTRGVLLGVLNSQFEQSIESAQRIEAFKQNMCRFNSKKAPHSQPTLFTALSRLVPEVTGCNDSFNNTDSI